MYIFYILVVLLFIFYLIYKKLINNFWVQQPVYHFWDISYWFYNKGIIQYSLPEKNKYCNFENIHCDKYENVSLIQKEKYIRLIQNHYNKNIYKPTIKTMDSHTINSIPSFCSLYTIEKTIKNQDKIFQEKEIIGGMITRPIKVKSKKIEIDVYYADFLCVHKKHRKKNIAAQIIQTHEYYQRHNNTNIQVSLFKKEGKLQSIIPICLYKNVLFDIYDWKIKPFFSPEKKILLADDKNIFYVYEKILQFHKIDIFIYYSFETMLNLIKNNIFFVYFVMEKENLEAVYCFQRYENYIENKEIITMNSSICFSLSNNEFIEYFKKTLYLLCQKHSFTYLNIENLSDNDILINDLLKLNEIHSQSINAYFFYNYAHNTFSSKKVFVFI